MIVRASALAGRYDPSREASEVDLSGLAQALSIEGGSVRTWSSGGLALAWAAVGAAREAPITDQGLVLVEGVIDNLDELGGQLPLLAGPSDPDALLRRLRGDFALLAFDGRSGRGLVARDHLGGRSVVWHHDGRRLSFATDVIHLLPLLAAAPPPDPAALAHWLAPSGPAADRTLYDGIRRLEAAHRLNLDGAPPRPRRYWMPVYGKPLAGSPADLAAGLRERLQASVARRAVEGASTGVLLSGGLDSATVAGLAARLEPSRRVRRAYSAVFPDHPSVDESALIDRLCVDLGLTSTRVVVGSGSVIGGAVEYIARWRLPPPSPNLYFWFPLLRQAAVEGTTVLLDGEGGDELFGCSPYLLADRLLRGRVRDAADLVRRMPGGGRHLTRRTVWRFLREFGIKGMPPAAVHSAVRRVRRGAPYAPSWLSPALIDHFLEGDRTWAWKNLDGPRWWAYLAETVTAGAARALAVDHVRRRAAQCGIMARHPLMDVDVIEYVLALPPELAFDPRFSRPMLRTAMAGMVPDEVRLRPTKSTFDAVFHESLGRVDFAAARSLLSRDQSRLGGYVDLDDVARRLLAAPPATGTTEWASTLWRFLTAECWLREQEDGGANLPAFESSAVRLAPS